MVKPKAGFVNTNVAVDQVLLDDARAVKRQSYAPVC